MDQAVVVKKGALSERMFRVLVGFSTNRKAPLFQLGSYARLHK